MALGRPHFIAAGSLVVLPLGLAVILTFMRPDLVAPMLDHMFGYVVVSALALLVSLGSGAMLLGLSLVDRFVRRERLATRGVLTLGVGAISLLLFTFPALLLMTISPIVFAFKFGNVEGESAASKRTSTDFSHRQLEVYPDASDRGWTVDGFSTKARLRKEAGVLARFPEERRGRR